MDLHSIVLNVRMLCCEGQWKGFYSTLAIGTARIAAIFVLLLQKSFIFRGLPDHECLEA